nr:hypothetical protein [Natronococcus occultus]
MLTAERRLSQYELADKADVSPLAVRNYRDRLEALDPIRVGENGYRLTLSFQTTTERRNPVAPPVEDVDFHQEKRTNTVLNYLSTLVWEGKNRLASVSTSPPQSNT